MFDRVTEDLKTWFSFLPGLVIREVAYYAMENNLYPLYTDPTNNSDSSSDSIWWSDSGL